MKHGIKYRWQLPSVSLQAYTHLVSKFNLSYPVVETLISRGYTDESELESYLFSSLERDVAHTALMKDAQKAVERIIEALNKKEKILICGDYDVDGITSSAMMILCLRSIGANVNFFLPNRARDGYGLSVKTVEKAAKSNYKVLITVDNGITAFKAAQKACELGLDLIITDHHKPHEKLPAAFAIVNPQQEACKYPYKSLAGVGVTFKILSLLYENLGKPLPEKVYELLLLGTVADVVPLVGENRFWVRHGLKYINKCESLAVKVLKNNARVVKEALNSLDIGFFLAPQINALGRLEDARDGVKFLIGNNTQDVERIGKVLQYLNEARKKIERSIFSEIETTIQEKHIDLETDSVIIAYSSQWPTGVIGLVASRLVNAYNRPVILFHKTADNMLKGSCRSIGDYNIFDALSRQADLLDSFGGHAQAAGLSLSYNKLSEFKERLNKDIKSVLPTIDPKKLLKLDAQLTLSDANAKLINDLNYLEPFGNSNEQPVFYINQATIIEEPTLLKEAHVKCKIFADGVVKPIIFFNRPELKEILDKHKDKELSFAVYVTENQWNGKSFIQLQGVDIAL